MGTTSTSNPTDQDPEAPRPEPRDPEPPRAEAASAPEPRGAPGGTARTLVRIARGTGLALLMAALGYAGGRIHGGIEAAGDKTELRAAAQAREAELDRAREQQQAALTAARDKLAQAQRGIARLTEVLALYQGYRKAQHALLDLDARNFGMAQSHLRQAHALLDPLATRIEGLPEVLGPLSETNIIVAGDLAQQRDSVEAIVGRLDAILDEVAGLPTAGASPGP